MPPQVADWEQVKATAIALGNLKEAAEQHGVEYGAARVRAHREQWPVGHRVHKLAREAQETANRQIIASSKGAVTVVTSAADALADRVKENGNRSKLALGSYTAKASERLDQLPDDQLLAYAQTAKALADTHSKLYPEQQAPGMVLNVFAISANTHADTHVNESFVDV